VAPWWIATLSLCAIALVPAGPARTESLCPEASPKVAVELNLPPTGIDNSLPQPALQELAGKRYHGGRTLGLYRTRLQTSFNLHISQRDVGSDSCLAIDRVTIRIEMPIRIIYVIRARQPGTCPYDSVLAHERKHEATDNAVLAEEIPRLKRDIVAALGALAAAHRVPIGDAASALEALTKAARTAVERETTHFFERRAARQAGVDTPQEYRRVRAACG
jgi:hypothetical protein